MIAEATAQAALTSARKVMGATELCGVCGGDFVMDHHGRSFCGQCGKPMSEANIVEVAKKVEDEKSVLQRETANLRNANADLTAKLKDALAKLKASEDRNAALLRQVQGLEDRLQSATENVRALKKTKDDACPDCMDGVDDDGNECKKCGGSGKKVATKAK